MTTDNRRGTTTVDLDLNTLTPKELLRLQRLARELRLTDQILSNDLDTVAVVQSGPAPAWTTLDGDKVSFAMNAMPKPNDRSDIAVWLGTNAHELGHVLYSPRTDSTLMFRVLESEKTFLPGIAMLHNIVEDQRQERLILGRFTPWTGYLTAALGHHLHVNDDAWLLMAGRTWLPDSVRAQAKAAMVEHHGQTVTDSVTRIVGEYQRLVDPGDTESDEAWELLQELHSIFSDDMPRIPTGCTVMQDGEPDTSEPGDGAPATADEADESDGESGDTGSGPAEADDDSDASDGEADGEGEGEASDGDDDGEAQSSSGAGEKPGTPQPLQRDDVRKALKEHAESQIEGDDEAQDDLDSIAEALDHGRGSESSEGDAATGVNVDATDRAMSLHREVADALLDLKDESEPGWLKRTESGRLNVRRLLNPNTEPEEMFDRYEPGMMDSTELEVMVLLDISGSMGGQTHALGEAAWAIRHAVDDLEGRCTVFTWDSGPHQVLADADVRPDGRMFVPQSRGGTNPQSVLTEAFRLIAGSDARNRLVVILTDGSWGNAERSENVIRALNEEGVTTVCALLGAGAGDDLHGCQFGAQIDDPAELARLFRRVATDRIRSWR